MSKEKLENKKKKKKKLKINWTKVCVWFALLAMLGSALLAIISPLLK